MPTINETFTEEEWATLKKAKGNRTWRKFLLSAADKILADTVFGEK